MDASHLEASQRLLNSNSDFKMTVCRDSAMTSDYAVELVSVLVAESANGASKCDVTDQNPKLVDARGRRGVFVSFVETVETAMAEIGKRFGGHMKVAFKVVMLIAYTAYFVYCMQYRFGDEGSIVLLTGTSVFAIYTCRKLMSSKGYTCSLPFQRAKLVDPTKAKRMLTAIRFILYFLATAGLALYFGFLVLPSHPRNSQSILGIFCLIVVCFILSKKSSRVNWHPVFWGFVIQFLFAILTLRTEIGYLLFKRLGDAVTALVDFSDYGAAFVLGNNFKEMGLAYRSGSILIFFNAIIFLLIHWGVLEFVIVNLGRVLAYCLQTGPVESVIAVANIFIGMSEAPLLIRPYLPKLSRSEMCAVMTCGFASVSGATLGLFISYGAPANHLLTAAVISAPAAMAITKLVYPETEETDLSVQTNMRIMDGTKAARSVLSACSEGAVSAVKIVTAIMANMLALVSILKLIDAAFDWLGQRAGVDGLSFAKICSYVLYPLAYAMGAEPSDCGKVGTLIGIKLFATPMVGYAELGKIIKNRHIFESYVANGNNSWHWSGDDVVLDSINTTLVNGIMSARSEVITTYAMCGFSAFTAIGICIGTMVPMCPSRKQDIIELVFLAFLAGNVASFATGAVAGLLYTEDSFVHS
ncbi:unnamed protein product [Lymnaea stagnalis]|uniref:Sodium/nucleoside cotransporter n=1 Tax=Lymnaea stagnalis TaxID=6523 RepID=A0AAV2GZV7_LYMST